MGRRARCSSPSYGEGGHDQQRRIRKRPLLAVTPSSVSSVRYAGAALVGEPLVGDHQHAGAWGSSSSRQEPEDRRRGASRRRRVGVVVLAEAPRLSTPCSRMSALISCGGRRATSCLASVAVVTARGLAPVSATRHVSFDDTSCWSRHAPPRCLVGAAPDRLVALGRPADSTIGRRIAGRRPLRFGGSIRVKSRHRTWSVVLAPGRTPRCPSAPPRPSVPGEVVRGSIRVRRRRADRCMLVIGATVGGTLQVAGELPWTCRRPPRWRSEVVRRLEGEGRVRACRCSR